MMIKWTSQETKKELIIDDFINTYSWQGSESEATRTMELTIVNSKEENPPNIKAGDFLKLTNKNDNIFVGRVTNTEQINDVGTVSISAKDFMTNLTRSTGTYKFKNKTAEAITRAICKDAIITTGSIEASKIKITKMIFSDKPYYEIIMAAYTEANKKTNVKYMAAMNGTKFEVVKKGQSSGVYLKVGDRIINSTYTESSDDVVNQILIYDSNNNLIGKEKDSDSIHKYGMYQGTLTVEKGNGKAEAKRMLTGLSESAEVEAIGNINCISGKSISIYNPNTSMVGVYWITSDSHSFSNGNHTMTLELSLKNEMTKYESDEEEEDESTSTNTSTAVSTKGSSVVAYAKKFVGKVTYVFGASSPASGRSDCSGFTQYVYKKAAGVDIGRTTLTQVTKGTKVSKKALIAGDLILFKNTYRNGVSHVGISMGGSKFLHCGTHGVAIGNLSDSYWISHWNSARRIV